MQKHYELELCIHEAHEFIIPCVYTSLIQKPIFQSLTPKYFASSEMHMHMYLYV